MQAIDPSQALPGCRVNLPSVLSAISSTENSLSHDQPNVGQPGEQLPGARELFCEPARGEIEFFDEPPPSHDSRNRLLLSLPITGDLELTVKELRAKLRPIYAKARNQMRQAARSGNEPKTSSKSASLARYPVASKPVLSALYSYLRVMQIKKAKPEADAHKIAEEAGFLNLISGREHEPSLVTRRVKDYEQKAARLIANVAEGRFPDFSPNPNARDAKGHSIDQGERGGESQLELLSGDIAVSVTA